MKNLIRDMIQIYTRHLNKKKWLCVLTLTLVFSFLFNLIWANTLFLLFISFNAWQVGELHSTYCKNIMLHKSFFYPLRYYICQYITCLVVNVPCLVLLKIVYFLKIDGNVFVIAFALLWNFIIANFFGLMICNISQSKKLGLFFLIVYFVINFSTNWTLHESVSMISFNLQLMNCDELNGYNLLGLLSFILLIIGASMLFRKNNIWHNRCKIGGAIFIIGISILIITSYAAVISNKQKEETSYNKMESTEIYYRNIEKGVVKYFGEIIKGVYFKIDELNIPIEERSVRFDSFQQVPFTRYRKIPIEEKEGYIYINFFSAAMKKMNREEFYYRFFDRLIINKANNNNQKSVLEALNGYLYNYTFKTANTTINYSGYNIESFTTFLLEKYPGKFKDFYQFVFSKECPSDEKQVLEKLDYLFKIQMDTFKRSIE